MNDERQRFLEIASVSKRIIENVELAIVGKRAQIVLALTAWYCQGHILLEDVPGVAKTMLARALAQSVGCGFKRIQCTPDLLPTDVTGASIFNQKTAEFEFRPGPLFTQLLLADEINRTTPRTQAALLEAMAETRVTVDGVTRELERPFLVIATQNPVDHEGTFPLPEAQLDRFLMKFSLGYPGFEDELKMMDMLRDRHPIETLQTVATADELIRCQQTVRQVFVDPKVRDYILRIVHKSRDHGDVQLGGSPRATLALFRAGQAIAAIRGRNFVLPDDIKRIVSSVLSHRLILRAESRLRKRVPPAVVEDIVADVPVPNVTQG